MHLQITLLSRGLKLSNAKQGCRVSGLHFLWNRYHQRHSDIELVQVSASFSLCSMNNPCFTAGKRIWVSNCHATREHWKTTVFTSIVYVRIRFPKHEDEREGIAGILGAKIASGKLHVPSLWSETCITLHVSYVSRLIQKRKPRVYLRSRNTNGFSWFIFAPKRSRFIRWQ